MSVDACIHTYTVFLRINEIVTTSVQTSVIIIISRQQRRIVIVPPHADTNTAFRGNVK